MFNCHLQRLYENPQTCANLKVPGTSFRKTRLVLLHVSPTRSPDMVISTRNVEAFLKRTAIAHHQNLALFLESGYAIVVFLKTLRHCEYCTSASPTLPTIIPGLVYTPSPRPQQYQAIRTASKPIIRVLYHFRLKAPSPERKNAEPKMRTFKTHMINTNTFNIGYHLNSPSSDELHGQLEEPPPREVEKRADVGYR